MAKIYYPKMVAYKMKKSSKRLLCLIRENEWPALTRFYQKTSTFILPFHNYNITKIQPRYALFSSQLYECMRSKRLFYVGIIFW